MASTQMESVDEQHCVLCCDDMEFSACGSCDHPICLKCCLKLRMLRKENDCPVCRAQLKEVIVSKGYKSWAMKSLGPQPRQHFRDYGIHHESPDSQAKVDELLHHKCPICGEIFKSFALVKDHIRKIHSSYYCDICLQHLRIFTHERLCYTREALVRHRKKGDADDKSHRGHPLCQFCDERYLDDDELLSHLRKTHFWCHLCEKDGSQDYFPQYKELRKHFQTSHFLCEEDECVHEKFTSVFRAKIDFQAHITQKHSNRLSKAEARQARQVEIDFRFVPRQTDSVGVVSNRDYSFPEQRNDRYFGRRLGNRDRASAEGSGYGRQEAFSQEGSGDGQSRSVRNKGTDRDAGRATKDLRQEKERPKDSLKVTRGVEKNKEKNKNGGKIAKGPAQDKSIKRGRTLKDEKGDKDCEGTSRDTINGMKSIEMSQDKQKDKNAVSASKEVVQGDVPPKNQNSKNSHLVSESNNPSINEAAAIQKMTEKNEPVPQRAGGNSNGLVNLSSKTKTDTENYVDDFPALTLSVKQPVASNSASNSAPNSEQSSNRSTKKKTARSTNIRVPVPKQNYHDEFPSLIAMSKGTSATKAPPGLAAPVQPLHRPPPGLKWSVPPPGLAVTGAVVSSGNSGSSNKRDQQIIKEINYILDYRGQSFLRFREVSGQFRQGNTSAKHYYHECCGLLGEENMQKVFKELIDLLPDEEKRRELLGVYNDAKISSKQVQVEPAMSSSTKGFTNSSVTTSSHVLLQEGDFPALPRSSAKKPLKSQQAAGAWVRGR